MPSQPPAMPSTSAGAEQATAPVLPPDDPYQEPGTVAGSSAHFTTSPTHTPDQIPTPQTVYNAVDGDVDHLPPTDDKHELRRRQLQLNASEPPPLSSATHEVDDAECGPSAPLILDSDTNEYALSGAERGMDVPDNLPQYQR